jgi:hypothetical protein
LFHEEKEEEVVGVVVGMECLVSLADMGMQVFFCFSGRGVVGMQVFQDEVKVRMERLVDVGIEEDEEGKYLRKEPVPYCVNYKESVQ